MLEIAILYAVALGILGAAIGFVGLALHKRKRSPLTMIFYRRVIAISKSIETATATRNMSLINNCRNRIDSDSEFAKEEASVVRQMLLNDITDAIVTIKKFDGKQYDFLKN